MVSRSGRSGTEDEISVRMPVNLSCPLDWTENHHENIPLGMSTRMFLENFDYGGKTQLECQQYHAMDWTPGITKKERMR